MPEPSYGTLRSRIGRRETLGTGGWLFVSSVSSIGPGRFLDIGDSK